MNENSRNKFLSLRINLKKNILDYVSIADNFNSIFSCCKSFKLIIKKTKTQKNLLSNRYLNNLKKCFEDHCEYVHHVMKNWKVFFDYIDEAYDFIVRYLEKLFRENHWDFVFIDRLEEPEYIEAYKRFMMYSRIIKQLRFENLSYESKAEVKLLKNTKEIVLKNKQIDSLLFVFRDSVNSFLKNEINPKQNKLKQ